MPIHSFLSNKACFDELCSNIIGNNLVYLRHQEYNWPPEWISSAYFLIAVDCEGCRASHIDEVGSSPNFIQPANVVGLQHLVLHQLSLKQILCQRTASFHHISTTLTSVTKSPTPWNRYFGNHLGLIGGYKCFGSTSTNLLSSMLFTFINKCFMVITQVHCSSIAEVFSFSSGGVKVLHDQGGLGAPLEEEWDTNEAMVEDFSKTHKAAMASFKVNLFGFFF